DASTLVAIQQRNLPEVPRFIQSIDGSFLVASESAITRFDAGTLEPTRSVEIEASTIASSTGGIACTTNGALRVFSANMDEAYQRPLPEEATAARWAGENLIAWSPALGRVWRVGSPGRRPAAGPLLASDVTESRPASAEVVAPQTTSETRPPVLEPNTLIAPVIAATTVAVPE